MQQPQRFDVHDLVQLVAAETGRSAKAAEQVLGAAMDVIVREVTAGNAVALKNFAVFEPVTRAGRQYPPGFGPAEMTVPDRRRMRVRVSRVVQAIVGAGDPTARRRKGPARRGVASSGDGR